MSVAVEMRDGVCELRLEAPPGNVIDALMCRKLAVEIKERAKDPHLKAFLFTAAGKHFSFGASVSDHVPGEVERFLPAFHRVFFAIAEAGVPTITAVRGLCLGGAFEIAAFSNFVIAEETAEFGAPEITLGVIPPIACLVLPWKVGAGVAEDLVLSGRRMTATEARRVGLVSRTCAAGTLDDAVDVFLAEQVRPLSAAALRLTLRAVRGEFLNELGARLPELERLYLDDLMATHDAKEGIAAFLEKRTPTWVDA